ncbi:hypothetical protein niasHT_009821 [Heterodera trifolii]|uniref:Uncharacterized protein n=1 Tax=Heterodera trifolii TaxID=157864 RepID=A0ABD2LT18_9BILA
MQLAMFCVYVTATIIFLQAYLGFTEAGIECQLNGVCKDISGSTPESTDDHGFCWRGPQGEGGSSNFALAILIAGMVILL